MSVISAQRLLATEGRLIPLTWETSSWYACCQMCTDTISMGLKLAMPLVLVIQHFLSTSQHRSEGIDACNILAKDPQ